VHEAFGCDSVGRARSAGSQGGAPAEQCARVRNDDTIHPYDPVLKAGLLGAYAHLFPQARIPPDDRTFGAGTHIRCMDGRLLACFTGANLPCSKMNIVRENKGADAFCRSNPDSSVVPALATGHDTIYAYRCVARRAEVEATIFPLDARGFAAALRAPVERSSAAARLIRSGCLRCKARFSPSVPARV
jgi:hypothetical protein